MLKKLINWFSPVIPLDDSDIIIIMWNDRHELTLDGCYCILNPELDANDLCMRALGIGLTETMALWNSGKLIDYRGTIFETQLHMLMFLANRENELLPIDYDHSSTKYHKTYM